MPPRPKRTWTAPADEPFSFSSFRTPTQWSEPLQEESFCRQRRVKLLKATPKYLPGDKHRIRPSVHPPAMMPVSVCVFPKFKKLKAATPEQSHTKALKLKQKNADMWVIILSHLHRFSLLYQKTADSRYQDEHVTNILANYNQLSTARHFQIWQHFVDWCEPFGFHPANITTSFLLDFIYEATYQIRKQTYSMKSLIQALKFVASQAEVPKLMDILNTPVINGYVTSTKRPQNPREVFPLPFHVAISFEYYVQDDRRPESSRLILGCYLFMFLTGLRFQDLQRTKPHSISLNDGIIRAICELCKSGQPQPAACIACGLSSDSFCTGWGYAWYDLIKDWINVTTSSSPSFQMDFIFQKYKVKDSYVRSWSQDQCYTLRQHRYYDMLQNNLLCLLRTQLLKLPLWQSTVLKAHLFLPPNNLTYHHTGYQNKDITEVNVHKETDIVVMIQLTNFFYRRLLSWRQNKVGDLLPPKHGGDNTRFCRDLFWFLLVLSVGLLSWNILTVLTLAFQWVRNLIFLLQ